MPGETPAIVRPRECESFSPSSPVLAIVWKADRPLLGGERERERERVAFSHSHGHRVEEEEEKEKSPSVLCAE